MIIQAKNKLGTRFFKKDYSLLETTILIAMEMIGIILFAILCLRLFKLLHCWGFILMLVASLVDMIFFQLPCYIYYSFPKAHQFNHGTGFILNVAQIPRYIIRYGCPTLYIIGIIWCLIGLQKFKCIHFKSTPPDK